MPVLRSLLVGLLALGFAACGGGGGGGGSPAGTCATTTPGLCLVSCNLGCGPSGCGILEIAQNQVVAFTFNRPLDPSTVAGGGLSLADTNGQGPGGSFYVSGATATFVPETKVVGTATLFGFRAHDTYQLSLRGEGDPRALRATTGEFLGSGLSCALQVTRGIVDQDGQAPTAELVSPEPANRASAPRDGEIVLRFSELLDTKSFVPTSTADGPVLFRVRKTRIENGIRVCDLASTPVLLEGAVRVIQDPVQQVSSVTFTPAIRLPIASCVEIEITERTKDLAGTPARGALLTFVTVEDPPGVLVVAEGFSDQAHLDAKRSVGTWGGGAVSPGAIGGDGLHGEFDPTDGQLVAPNHYVWSTDNQPIKAPLFVDRSPGLSPVTDGVFRFASMVVPPGTTIEFRGRNPARVLVRGDLLIAGNLLLNGATLVAHDGNGSQGQASGGGGAGAGGGGAGAARGDGITNGNGAYSGQTGADVQLAPGHFYAARAAATGGLGASQYPSSGRNQDVTYGWSFGQFCAMVPAGGGGGGHASAGTVGRAVASPTMELGPSGEPGLPFDPFPLPLTVSSLEHFLVGGSGGGGGGAHAMLSTKGFPAGPHWFSGSAGAGGGGALALRVGHDLQMPAGSSIAARGGEGMTYALAALDQGPPAPGGGGSGGSVLLQTAGSVALLGTIDTSGGKGSRWDLAPTLPMEARGGDGADGRVRLEAPVRPPFASLGRTLPAAKAADVDVLRDQDAVVGVQSLWYTSKQVFAPSWLRYEVEAEVSGQPRTFSDDPAVGIYAGLGAGQAVTLLVQGSSVSPATGALVVGTQRPWRDRVGPGGNASLAADECNGVRFLLLFDRRVAGQIVVKRVTFVFREKP